jgi:putative methyltransferase (TIGR04325 family)
MISDLKHVARSALAAIRIRPYHPRFHGVFATYDQAMAAVRPGALGGYNHEVNAAVDFEKMCNLALRDYPALFWLERLSKEIKCVIDAGGHMGTKYRAFRKHSHAFENIQWVIYDLPAIVRAGRERAHADGLMDLSFVESLADAPPADLLLASGLLQYLDIPFSELLGRLQPFPRHIILNKVATRDGPSIVTLENLGPSETPYQIRNRNEFEASLRALGYVVVDQWIIPELSHTIPLHPALGSSTSRGYYLRRADL